MNQTSNGITEIFKAVVDVVAESGSAFATNVHGEQIFVNKRIVEKMGVKEQDLLKIYAVPNYPDMQDRIPWRATRVHVVSNNSEVEDPIDIRLRRLLARQDTVVKSLWEFDELCDELGEEEQVVSDLLDKFMQDGIVVNVEAFSLVDEDN